MDRGEILSGQLPAQSTRRNWLARWVLRGGFVSFKQVTRLLFQISPSLADLLEESLRGAQEFQHELRLSQPAVVSLRVGDTRFRLYLVPNHEIARSEYAPLAGTGEAHEPVATACLGRVLQRLRDPVFMDLGAFMGYFACYTAALLGDRRDVWAVDSNPVFCDAVRRATALNGFERLHVLEAALSDRREIVTLDDTAVIPSQDIGPGRRQVEAVTLDELCARHSIKPTVLKVDVHGSEGKVLRGMHRTLQEHIQVVMLELHDLDYYRRYSPGVTRLELLDLLAESGFSCFHIAGHRLEHRSQVGDDADRGRFAYVPLTAATRELLLFDRSLDILLVACRSVDLCDLLGPPLELARVVG